MTDERISREDETLLVEFPESFDESPDGFESAFTDVCERARSERPTALVTHVQSEDPYGPDVFHEWETAAEELAGTTVERWAVVAPGIKKLSLGSQIRDDLFDVDTTERVEEALEWAQSADRT